jgi:hypothetical protein
MARNNAVVCSRLRLARVDIVLHATDHQSHAEPPQSVVPELDHLVGIVSGVDMHDRNGSGAGQNALVATCTMTTESFPPENSRTGRSKVAATSRKMCAASASSARRWDSSYVVVAVEPALRTGQN